MLKPHSSCDEQRRVRISHTISAESGKDDVVTSCNHVNTLDSSSQGGDDLLSRFRSTIGAAGLNSIYKNKRRTTLLLSVPSGWR